MPRSADQNQALRASTRAKLLSAALLLFARDGYAATSVRAVANESGLATGLLYSHFQGKEALLRAVFEESMADVRASLALADAAPVTERLAALVRGSVAILKEHLDFWRLSYATRTQPSVLTAVGPALPEWTASILESLRRYLADTGSSDPEGDAHALFAQIDGLCQHFALQPDSYPVDAVAERVIRRWQRSDFSQPEP
ncbi:MAG: TetR family transcriptional regulator [Gemmatimonadota bacterium]